MNSIELATRISWTLQSAIGIAFALALIGLAVELKRPAAHSLAVAWIVTLVGLIGTTAMSFLDPLGRNPLVVLTFGGLALAGVSGSLPAFENAIVIITGVGTPTTPRALYARTLRWAVALVIMAVVLVGLGEGPLKSIPWFSGIAGRLVIVSAYLLLALRFVTVRRRAARQYRRVITLMICACAMQALRPLIVIYYVARNDITAVTDLDALTYIATHVFTISILGVASLLAALAEERAATVATGRQLQDAALRVERAHRLESVGRLASGVAHDFNNLLTVIVSSVGLARDARASGVAVDEELAEIEKAAARGALLTAQLLAFARQQPQQLLRFDATARIQQMSSILERLVGSAASLCIDVPSSPIFVHMDPVRLEQIVLNLVSNAKNAVRSGGRISVRISAVRVDNTIVRAADNESLAMGEYLSIAVRDDGRGIADEVLNNLFEPFFTTRQDEGGTGLGLATVHSIARQAGGDVTVESVLGQGATFTVIIPTVAEDSARSSH